MGTPRRQSFLSGAMILTATIAVTKVIGALYKIPLGNLLDSEGMAHFYAAYNIYRLLLTLSTAGLPLALSRMVSEAEALGMLRKLNNRSHKVITGVAIAHGGQILKAECEETEVIFRNCSDQELEKYVNSRDPMDKAGAYGIQTGGARLIKAIRGCYYNVVGLPVARMLQMLNDLKVEV
jgi:hypothetical protein